MDILFFFKERTGFIRRFYEDAGMVFEDRMATIEDGGAPYDHPPYSCDGEPPFLVEWIDAKNALEVLGLACVSILSASLNLYFVAWESKLGVTWEKNERKKLFREKGLKGYVNEIEKLLKLQKGDCSTNVELLEQLTLARNAAQHPENINDLIPLYRRSDLKKHPRPFFMSDDESILLEGELADVSFLVPRVRVYREQLFRAIDEAESFVVWLNDQSAAHVLR